MAEEEERLIELRPELHRYCARMTGSVIDGEDVVQDVFTKAVAAMRDGASIDNLRAWLFRVAHNAALDLLRRRERANALYADEDPEMLTDFATPVDDPDIVEASLRTFMRLPAGQRSSVILMDVLGYRLQEICTIMDASLPAVKSALHRGRTRLQQIAREPIDQPVPPLSAADRARLSAYVERFNARDFDSLREMLADDVKLEVVGAVKVEGKEQVDRYFGNYAGIDDWLLAAGQVDGRPAIIVFDPASTPRVPRYFVLLEWNGGEIASIRDFRHARYAIVDAEVTLL